MFRGKKGQVVSVIIVIAVIVLLLWLVDFGRRECKTDRNCGKEYYCGSDFKCHEKETVIISKSYDLIIPTLILAVAIIVSAFVLRYKWNKKKPESEKQEEFKYY